VLSVAEKRDHAFDGVESGLPAASEFSPDGRWIAYQIGEGRAPNSLSNTAIYVQPVPPTGAQWLVSSGTVGFRPMWSPDGKEILYGIGARGPEPQWVAAPIIATHPTFTVGAARPLPAGNFVVGNGPNSPLNLRNYGMAADGRRIGLVPAPTTSGPQPPDLIQVVLNWSDELKTRVPAK
jgi:hypothetical protein